MNTGLRVEVRDRVAYLEIDRPESRNAINSVVQDELIAAIEQFSTDRNIWVVQLTGSGDVAFSAGVDLKELARGRPGDDPKPRRGNMRPLFEAVLDCPKPVIAAINGSALGGGCELALACDLRVASDAALLGMPEVKRGLGGAAGAQLLCRLAPLAVAQEMLFFGEPITADEALRHGLFNRVVPRTALRDEAEAYTRRLLKSAPISVWRHKVALRTGADLPLAAALRLSVHPDPYTSKDRHEGIAAFAEKREPVWQAR